MCVQLSTLRALKRLTAAACKDPGSDDNGAPTESQIPARQLRTLCALDEAGERILEMAVRRMSLSARAHDRVLKVARTIADLSASASVAGKHLAEAVQYRSLDRSYWT